MAGERLFEFDCDLCDYLVGNIRQHLNGVAERPTTEPSQLHPNEWDRLDFPHFFARQLPERMSKLSDYVWAGVFDEVARLPLNDAELDALALALRDVPMRLEDQCVWVPYPELHSQSVECVSEIRTTLAKQYAEEWGDASANFAARLCSESLPMWEGIGIVQEWLWHIRRLLRAMGAIHLLPQPLGSQPTPTHGELPASQARNDAKPKRTSKAIATPAATAAVDKGMLSPAKISTEYSISRSTVYAACRSGVLSHYRVPAKKGAKGKYLIKEVDLQAWLETLKSSGEAMTPSASAPASSRSAPASPFSELDPRRLAKAWKK